MEHIKRVEEEFTRQAQTFDTYAPKADDRVEDRFRDALGDAAKGVILGVPSDGHGLTGPVEVLVKSSGLETARIEPILLPGTTVRDRWWR